MGTSSLTLLIKVFRREGGDTSGGGEVLVKESPVFYQASPRSHIDFALDADVYRGASRFHKLTEKLSQRNIRLTTVPDDAVDHLTRSLGKNGDDVGLLRAAQQLGDRVGLDAEMLYALGGMGLPLQLEELARLTPTGWRKLLERARANNFVSVRPGNETESFTQQLSQAVVEHVFTSSPDVEHPSVGDLLSGSLNPVEVQKEVFSLYLRRDESSEDFAEVVTERFGQDVHDDLQLACQLRFLLQDHVPLLKKVREIRADGKVRQLSDLTNLTTDEWRTLLEELGEDGKIPLPTHIRGATQDERVENYIRGIQEPLQTVFPEVYLDRALTQEPEINLSLVRALKAANPSLDPKEPLGENVSWQGIPEADREKARESWQALGAEARSFPAFRYETLFTSQGGTFENPIRKSVNQLMNNIPALRDLGKSNIQKLIEENKEVAWQSIPEEHQTAVLHQLEANQRLARITPRANLVRTLSQSGFRSAWDVARIPRKQFLGLYGKALGGHTLAGMVHRQSQLRVAANELLLTAMKDAYHEPLPYIIGGTLEDQEQAKNNINLPNASIDLEKLFGSQDYCECQHCRSVLSPAAYLVDLLHFLDVPQEAGKAAPLTELLNRRPDLQHILLSCENTHTVIPYIDLGNEVLESYLVNTFVNPGAQPQIEAFDIGGATAEELRAIPQHVNHQAYEHLSTAIYPMSLPFHRPLEVIRSYLEHLGTSRREIMQTLQKGNLPDPLAVATESLALSPGESALIFGSEAPQLLANPWDYYGYDSNQVGNESWMDVITKVPAFLRRTGLQFEDLVALINTRFLNPHLHANPAQAIRLHTDTPNCSLRFDGNQNPGCRFHGLFSRTGSSLYPALAKNWLDHRRSRSRARCSWSRGSQRTTLTSISPGEGNRETGQSPIPGAPHYVLVNDRYVGRAFTLCAIIPGAKPERPR